MSLVQLVYASRLTPEASGTQLTDIVEVSQRNNAAVGVTGALCFNHSFFLQCLEGGREAVNRTYHRIAGDPRHDELMLLRYGPVRQRSFSDWSMGYVPAGALTPERLLRHAPTAEFDPLRLDGDAALGLLLDLHEAARRLHPRA